MADDGRDTALARLLLARGALDLATLRACLDEVRRRRVREPDLDLSAVLRAHGANTGTYPDAGRASHDEDDRSDPTRPAAEAPRSGTISPRALEEAEALVGAAERATAPAVAAPTLGGYRLVRELARGGMGRLYEAEQVATGARRALKTIVTAGIGPEEAARFRREGELLARLDHPAIVRVHEASLGGQTPFLVMDLLPGGSLQARLQAGPLPVDEAVSIAIALAQGLAHAHERGVLHRDLKPLNVVFDDQGRPRLVDLGLARPLDRSSLTVSGTLLGTPSYMSPEQAQGAPTDVRTDVFGLGAVLYASLAGRAPFVGTGAMAVLLAAIEGRATPLRELRPDVPPAVARVVARAMAVSPADRFASAAELARALEEAARAPAPRQGRGALVTLGVIATLIAVALAVARSGPGPAAQPAQPVEGADVASREPARPVAAAGDAAVASLVEALALGERGHLGEAVAAVASDGRIARVDLEALGALAAFFDGAGGEAALRSALSREAYEAAHGVKALEGRLPALEDGTALLAIPAPDVEGYRALVAGLPRVQGDPATRALVRRAQRVVGRTIFAHALLREERSWMFDLADDVDAAMPGERAFTDGVRALLIYRDQQSQPRARDLLAERARLPGRYATICEAVRICVRFPGIDAESADETLRRCRSLAVMDIVAFTGRTAREVGRLHRLEAWRQRRADRGADVAGRLERARALGAEAARGHDAGHELQEHLLTLLASGEGEWPQVERGALLVGEEGQRKLIQAELLLAQDEPGRALAIIRTAVTHRFIESDLVEAHALHRLGDASGAAATLERARASKAPTFGIEWRSLELAEAVMADREWWPGLLRTPKGSSGPR